MSLLHVSVFNDHHQGTLSVPNLSYIYVKTLGKIKSLYKLGDVAAFCRTAHATLQSHAALHTTHMLLYSLTLHCTQHACRSTVSLCTAHNTHAALDMLPHHLIYITT